VNDVRVTPRAFTGRRRAVGWRAGVGLLLVGLLGAAALAAPLLVPYHPDMPDLDAILMPPTAAHIFGTDDLGRDLFSRVLYGARASYFVSMGSVVFAGMIGTSGGIVAGYFGRGVDEAVMLVANTILSFPGILLALALATLTGPSLENALIAIVFVNVPVFVRIARAQTLVVRELGYITAERALGFSHFHIVTRAIAPNILAPLIVQGSLLLASAMIMESYLSFLGLSAQPPTPTLGNMLRQSMGFLGFAQWLAWFPGLAIFFSVFGFNLLGDGLLDYLDPRPTR
jgi:peptide/nickel transport system permease protein